MSAILDLAELGFPLELKTDIEQKLKNVGAYIDKELPDYIIVLLANKKTEHQMVKDLKLFLGPNTDEFVKWVIEKSKRDLETNSSTLKESDTSSMNITEENGNKELKEKEIKPNKENKIERKRKENDDTTIRTPNKRKSTGSLDILELLAKPEKSTSSKKKIITGVNKSNNDNTKSYANTYQKNENKSTKRSLPDRKSRSRSPNNNTYVSEKKNITNSINKNNRDEIRQPAKEITPLIKVNSPITPPAVSENIYTSISPARLPKATTYIADQVSPTTPIQTNSINENLNPPSYKKQEVYASDRVNIKGEKTQRHEHLHKYKSKSPIRSHSSKLDSRYRDNLKSPPRRFRSRSPPNRASITHAQSQRYFSYKSDKSPTHPFNPMKRHKAPQHISSVVSKIKNSPPKNTPDRTVKKIDSHAEVDSDLAGSVRLLSHSLHTISNSNNSNNERQVKIKSTINTNGKNTRKPILARLGPKVSQKDEKSNSEKNNDSISPQKHKNSNIKTITDTKSDDQIIHRVKKSLPPQKPITEPPDLSPHKLVTFTRQDSLNSIDDDDLFPPRPTSSPKPQINTDKFNSDEDVTFDKTPQTKSTTNTTDDISSEEIFHDRKVIVPTKFFVTLEGVDQKYKKLDINRTFSPEQLKASQPKRDVKQRLGFLPHLFSQQLQSGSTAVSNLPTTPTITTITTTSEQHSPATPTSISAQNQFSSNDTILSPVTPKPISGLERKLSAPLSTPPDIAAEKCRFWPNCKFNEKCEFHHPTLPCKNFPKCKFGSKCLYVHPDCKFDPYCTKKDCPFVHRKIKSSPQVKSNVYSFNAKYSQFPSRSQMTWTPITTKSEMQEETAKDVQPTTHISERKFALDEVESVVIPTPDPDT